MKSMTKPDSYLIRKATLQNVLTCAQIVRASIDVPTVWITHKRKYSSRVYVSRLCRRYGESWFWLHVVQDNTTGADVALARWKAKNITVDQGGQVLAAKSKAFATQKVVYSNSSASTAATPLKWSCLLLFARKWLDIWGSREKGKSKFVFTHIHLNSPKGYDYSLKYSGCVNPSPDKLPSENDGSLWDYKWNAAKFYGFG